MAILMGVPPHKIEDIYDSWVRRGKPVCHHPHRDKVQDMGAPPEEYVCTACGVTWDIGDDPPEPSGE